MGGRGRPNEKSDLLLFTAAPRERPVYGFSIFFALFFVFFSFHYLQLEYGKLLLLLLLLRYWFHKIHYTGRGNNITRLCRYARPVLIRIRTYTPVGPGLIPTTVPMWRLSTLLLIAHARRLLFGISRGNINISKVPAVVVFRVFSTTV